MSFVKKIRIKNFKNLEDVEIDVKPLTFLFGPNGSGKSSFMKAMMFLKKNIYPINSSQTIYKISEELDLISYEEIVSHNDINRDIIFSIDLNGSYNFPSEEIFSNDFFSENYYDISNRHNFNFDKFLDSNLFVYLENNSNYSYYKSDLQFNFTYDITFTHNPIGYNLKSVIIIDNDTKYSVEIYVNDVIIYNREIIYRMSDIINFNSKNEMYKEYEKYLSISRGYDGYSSAADPDADDNLYPMGRLNIFPSVYYLNNDKFDEVKTSKDKYDLDVFLKVHYDVFRFVFVSHKVIHTLLDEFLDYKHLPITRELPKSTYALTNNSFAKNDYYNLLNRVFIAQYDTSYYLRGILENKSDIKKGKNFIEDFELAEIENIYLDWLNGNQYYISYYYKINFWLLRFGFDPILIKKLYNNGLILFKGTNNNLYNFTSCSSGLIQLLPIILYTCHNLILKKQIIFFNKNSEIESDFRSVDYNNFNTLFIEQPELHLHPKIQSKLAFLFRDCASNLFIETHSEHLIRKIQVLIAKGELDREKVSVLYFDNKNEKTKIEKMNIDKNGLFEKDWPDGFFDDSINLTMELYEALRKSKN